MRLISMLVIVGCSRSAEPVAASPRAEPVTTQVLPDASQDSLATTDPDPPADPAPAPGPTDEKVATPVDARVIDIKRNGGELTLTLDRGSSHGITRTWRGEFMNPSYRLPEGARFALTRITQHTCVAVVTMAKLPSERVRLYPR